MRFIFKSAAHLAAVLALATSLSAEVTSKDESGAVRKAEARGLSSVPTSRFTGLLTAPENAPEVSFSSGWLDTQPTPTGNANWACLTEALYFEARGEILKGQFAVAEVIMNRVKSARYPDNICGVINQGTGRKYQCQFTYTCDGNPEHINEPRAWERVGKVAKIMLSGAPRALTGGATYYHTTAVNPSWSRKFNQTAAIGVHQFYRPDYRISSN